MQSTVTVHADHLHYQPSSGSSTGSQWEGAWRNIRIVRQAIEPPLQEPLATKSVRDYAGAYLAPVSQWAAMSATHQNEQRLDRQSVVAWLYFQHALSASTPHTDQTASEVQLELEQAVVAEFASLAPVAEIYADKYRAEFIFNIFLSNENYDDQLMDQLLDRELRLVQRFAPVGIAVHYLPLTSATTSRPLTRTSARLIFRGA